MYVSIDLESAMGMYCHDIDEAYTHSRAMYDSGTSSVAIIDADDLDTFQERFEIEIEIVNPYAAADEVEDLMEDDSEPDEEQE